MLITVADMIEELSKMPQDAFIKVRHENGGLYGPNWPLLEKIDKENIGDLIGISKLKRGDEIVVI